MVLVNEHVIECVKNVLEAHSNLQKDESGYYYGDIHADYRDKLDLRTIQKIFNSDNPRDKFYEIINDAYFYSDGGYYDEVIETIKNRFDEKYDDWEDLIRDWVYENVYFNYPYDYCLNQDVCVDIIVDTGDGNYDYTQNELFGCVYVEKGIAGKEQSSLLWLMQQQGYTMEQIVAFIENGDSYNSKFLTSVKIECQNTTTCMNALAFFVKMSLEEALNLHEMLQNRGKRSRNISLTKETPCGLYDPWSGAGSVLGIKLEKDVELPLKYIDSILPDGCRGYGVDDIYGMCSSFWKSNCIKEINS